MKLVIVNPLENEVDPKRISLGVITINEKNPEVGSIMFREERKSNIVLGKNFSGSVKPKVYFQNETVEALKTFVSENNIKANDTIKGYKLVVKESTTPFFAGQKSKINPKTEEKITFKGNEVYRDTIMVEETSEEKDVLLPSDSTGMKLTTEIESLIEDSKEIN